MTQLFKGGNIMFKLNESVNVERLVTASEFEAITDEEMKFCQDKAAFIDSYIKYYTPESYRLLKARRAEEIVFTQRKYEDLTDIQRATIVSLVAFKDDEFFIRALLKSGATLKDLDGLNSWIPFIREAKKLNQTSAGLAIWEKNLLKICSVTKEFFGYDTPHIVLNRINMILAFNRELFTEIEQEYVIESYKAQVLAEIAKINKQSIKPRSMEEMKNINIARNRLRSISELDQDVIESIIYDYDTKLQDTIDQKIKTFKK